MAAKEYDLWQEQFSRECGIRSAIILYGNTGDLTFDPSTYMYTGLVDVLVPILKKRGFERVQLWDRVKGSRAASGQAAPAEKAPAGDAQQGGSQPYDMGDLGSGFEDSNLPPQRTPNDIQREFTEIYHMLQQHDHPTAVIFDGSDYIFGNANAFSPQELQYLATWGRALQEADNGSLERGNDLPGQQGRPGNILILITHRQAAVPPVFYLENPLVASVHVPLPGRNERERYVNTYRSSLRLDPTQNLGTQKILDNFLDALDGFSLRDIQQLFKLSRQQEPLKFEKLINLYKYGEKISPWEELSHEKLEKIEETLRQRVKGQDEAIEKVRNVVIRAKTGFSGLQHSRTQKKPKGTLFFVGPTGVGKTELAKALAEFIFGDEDACIRFDMSEYNHEHSDQRLVGAPPGYVGFEAGGQLTNAVKKRPFCVLLFDEIEKAHGRILDKFLQILEDGRLTDGKGETVHFSETIIIFTSNLGADQDFTNETPDEVRKSFIKAVHDHFCNELKRPELWNRIGESNIVAFNYIDNPEIFTKIALLKFQGIADYVRERYKATLEFDDEKKAMLAIAERADKKNGGRGMLNIMENMLINPLSEFIFEHEDQLENRRILIETFVKGRNVDFDFDFA